MASYLILFFLLFFWLNSDSNARWIASMNPITLSNSTLIHLLNNGGYAIISGDRNPALSTSEVDLTDEIIYERLGNLSTDITNMYLYSTVLGKYDGISENSFLVILHNDSPEQERTTICKLGEKYNQESVIYVKQAIPVVQQLIYTTGPFNGTYIEGEGYKILSANVTDNYSNVKLCSNNTLTFTLNFNFEEMITTNNHRIKTQQLIQHHAHNKIINQLYQTARLN